MLYLGVVQHESSVTVSERVISKWNTLIRKLDNPQENLDCSNFSRDSMSQRAASGVPAYPVKRALNCRNVALQMYALWTKSQLWRIAMVILNRLEVEAPQDISMPMCLKANFTLHASGTKPWKNLHFNRISPFAACFGIIRAAVSYFSSPAA